MVDLTGGFGGFYDYDATAEFQQSLYEYAGTNDAPYTGGLINTFNYRNWELNLNFSYYFGAHVRTILLTMLSI